MSDTIYAFASGAGRAAIGVFRLSGPGVRAVVEAMTGSLPLPRYAHLTDFNAPHSREVLDRGLVLWFPGPASFTGEDMAEFQIHAGPAVIAAFVRAFSTMDDIRPAQPGEFTRRAFLNGKLDLSAVEGLSDLIEAETEMQRRQALRQMSGSLRDQALKWRGALLEASALLEGEIDFSDEADVPKEMTDRVVSLIQPILAGLAEELGAGRRGERIRDGLIIVIAGPPNAGKSTLLNALARREVAIVSPYAGTTRDALEVRLDLEGVPVNLIDTAGLRESADPVETIGIARAREKSQSADLVLWLCETASPVAPDAAFGENALWVILTKCDLHPPGPAPAFETALSLSASTGENMELLLDRLAAFGKAAISDGETALITRERHRRAFMSAKESLKRVVAAPDRGIELLAEDLRLSIRALECLIGNVDVEDVLGEIFSRFCIGK